ncbi:transformer-2 protein [Anaeramoeba ignava]|uniref:Transformer-2 protein n=1 Tax=Anaeramoeba ignava TaxID=1746090 RepID=A0A9Q0LD49_ANAIG|nr:transformer-2 protein [Anaeramoeba ignava]
MSQSQNSQEKQNENLNKSQTQEKTKQEETKKESNQNQNINQETIQTRTKEKETKHIDETEFSHEDSLSEYKSQGDESPVHYNEKKNENFPVEEKTYIPPHYETRKRGLSPNRSPPRIRTQTNEMSYARGKTYGESEAHLRTNQERDLKTETRSFSGEKQQMRSQMPSHVSGGYGDHGYEGRHSNRSHSRSRSRSRSPYSHRRHRTERYSRDRGYYSYSRTKTYSRPHYEKKKYYQQSHHREPAHESPPSNIVGVFGLPRDVETRDLSEMFSNYGDIERIHIVKDKKYGVSKGFAFVYFVRIEDAIQAKNNCSGKSIRGRVIRTDFSMTQGPRETTQTPYYMGMTKSNDRFSMMFPNPYFYSPYPPSMDRFRYPPRNYRVEPFYQSDPYYTHRK